MRKILSKLVLYLRTIIKYFQLFFKAKEVHKKNEKFFVLIATPIYTNLGDYAIVYAQLKLLYDCGIKNVLELTRREYEILRKYLGNIIRDEDVIIIDGGGNIGTLWIEEEYKIRDIISRFSNNPIIVFPQTAFFENSKWGEAELDKSFSTFNSHKNLTIFCRDKDTYELFLNKFSVTRIYYVPDIVTYLKPSFSNERNDTCLLCLRDDKESVRSRQLENRIINCLEEHNIVYNKFSTMSEKKVTKKNRFILLKNKLYGISRSKFMITDRLHGMLFAAITGTPCLAIDNISHKVKNGYEWIKSLDYILFSESEETIEKSIKELIQLSEKKFNYCNQDIAEYHDLIKEIVRSEAST